MFLLVFAACSAEREQVLPAHEFLVAAGDSTFWVRGVTSGILVRGAPLLLARLDGRFHELYLTDDDRSYFDAIFLGQRLWRRDLVTGDSLLVFEDSLVVALAVRHARDFPDAVPLAPDQDASDDPRTWASVELEILDVHGPYLSYEYHADVETRDGDESHLTNHGVLDLVGAERATLASLFGAEAAARLEAEGRRRFSAAMDSILQGGGTLDRRAADALAAFAFDAHSFRIVDRDGASAVAFAIPGRGPHAGGLTLELDPIPAGAPAWWEQVRPTLPAPTEDPLVARWRRESYHVLARHAPAGDRALLTLRDSTSEWRIGLVPTPVSRIEWLDEPAIDTVDRRALSRAFDEAALYDDHTSIARRERATGPVRLVTNARSLPAAPRLR